MRPVFFVLLLAAGSAQAKENPQDLYQQAQRHFNLGEFDRAIELFKEAYQLSEAPALLFNIGQAYRLKGDAKQAVFFYKRYLHKDPKAENRDDVESLIEQVEAEERARKNKEEREKDSRTLLPLAGAPREPGGGSKRTVGLVSMGVGVVLVGVGTVFAVRAKGISDDLSELSETGGQWSEGWSDRYQEGRLYDTFATASFIAGGAGIAVGAVVYYLGWREGRRVRVEPVPGGASVVMSCEF